jgi:arabinogalactan endo-1,4-beta-galactosidase
MHSNEQLLNILKKNMLEEFEDIKGVIRIRVWKKNRQHNGPKKKYKRTNNDLKKTTTTDRKIPNVEDEHRVHKAEDIP